MGCQEPLAGGVGAAHWIGGVWFGANPCMPAGISRDAPGFAMDGLAGCDVVTGWSHQAARNVVGPGEMRCDELGTSAGGGTLVERVERAYGDWLSAAGVAIVALAVWGE
jgi:hypothetical protein